MSTEDRRTHIEANDLYYYRIISSRVISTNKSYVFHLSVVCRIGTQKQMTYGFVSLNATAQ